MPHTNARFECRPKTAGTAANITGSGIAAPYWVKIVRAGNTITAYQSPDGASWTPVGTASIALGSTAFIGLAVSSHDNTRLCTASFGTVTR